MNKKRTVVVIGGGAAGMTAAVAAAGNGADVTIIEHKDRVGRKLLATGNGRCNYTNADMKTGYFRGTDLEIVPAVLSQFDEKKTLAFFEKLGIVPKSKNGLYYPKSEQASAILDVLRMELASLGVRILLEREVKSAVREQGGFSVTTQKEKIRCDRLVIAAGGKASPSSGSDGSGYLLARSFGHTIVPVVPALVQLRSKADLFRTVAGVRTDAKVTAFVDGSYCAEDTGELQLTDYGLSGIPVFQISRYISVGLSRKQKAAVCIDFLPDMEEEEAKAFFWKRKAAAKQKTAEEFLIGIFNKKLAVFLLKQAGIRPSEKTGKLSEKQMQKFVACCKRFEVPIEKTNPFEQAQVCAGGVKTTELIYDTMESRYVPGLYFAGEILDIDGMCGGYNLQWAWATGTIAGAHAAKG